MKDPRYTAPAISGAHGDARMGEALVSLVREALRQQGRVCLRLWGDSMWPTVPAGSLVALEPVAPERIRLGDVVAWQQDGDLIAHRVVQTVRDGSTLWLVTKGDNCTVADRRLEPPAVLGRLVAVHAEGDSAQVQSGWVRGLEAIFWVSRWRLRRLAGAVGQFLPAGIRKPLIRSRDQLGRYLSLGFKLALLRY
jgi:signal peptidase I